MGTSGAVDYLDVTMQHPLTFSSCMNSTTPNRKSMLVSAAHDKERNHAHFMRQFGSSVRLVPMHLITVGGWHDTAQKSARTIAD